MRIESEKRSDGSESSSSSSSPSRPRTKCGTRYASHAMAMAAKITPVVPTPRRYGGNRVLQAILSGVSQETDVTDVQPENGPIHTNDLVLSPLAEVLPTLQKSFRTLLGVQCEPQVIPPVTVDVQIARAEPLGPEAKLGHHPEALSVRGPDRDLDPMQ